MQLFSVPTDGILRTDVLACGLLVLLLSGLGGLGNGMRQ